MAVIEKKKELWLAVKAGQGSFYNFVN